MFIVIVMQNLQGDIQLQHTAFNSSLGVGFNMFCCKKKLLRDLDGCVPETCLFFHIIRLNNSI